MKEEENILFHIVLSYSICTDLILAFVMGNIY